VKPGKGGAFVQLELNALQGNTKTNQRVRSTETLTVVQFDSKDKYQVLYQEPGPDSDPESGIVVVMHTDTYEQLEVPAALFGEDKAYMFAHDGMEVLVGLHEGNVVHVEMPKVGAFEVESAPPVRSDTRDKQPTRQVKLTNGVYIARVPAHVEPGDFIKIHIGERRFVEKVKD